MWLGGMKSSPARRVEGARREREKVAELTFPVWPLFGPAPDKASFAAHTQVSTSTRMNPASLWNFSFVVWKPVWTFSAPEAG
jgi:hypothetical protein